jgi:hypothetical protein
VESNERLNIYVGEVTTDSEGVARVTLPSYFDSLNRDFGYQLTVIGQLAQAVVSDEILENAFSIKTDVPNVRVSWQVTGIRRDPWAEAHPLEVEPPKPDHEVGTYLHPEAHGKPSSMGTDYPVRQAREERERELSETTGGCFGTARHVDLGWNRSEVTLREVLPPRCKKNELLHYCPGRASPRTLVIGCFLVPLALDLPYILIALPLTGKLARRTQDQTDADKVKRPARS